MSTWRDVAERLNIANVPPPEPKHAAPEIIAPKGAEIPRATSLAEMIGQAKIRTQLEVMIRSAIDRKAPLSHVMLTGPAGLGKTTIARAIAHDMGARFVMGNGATLDMKGLAALINRVTEVNDEYPGGTVVFIDEIHRMNIKMQELLYPVLEDFVLSVPSKGKDPAPQTIDIPPFTMIGATTSSGLLSQPFRDRFQFIAELEYYSATELAQIIESDVLTMRVNATEGATITLGERSRGTPRIAQNLLRRTRDVAFALRAEEETPTIDSGTVNTMCELYGIDSLGLTKQDRLALRTLIVRYKGGPTGGIKLAATMGVEYATYRDVIEPWLNHLGLVNLTGRGRKATVAAYQHMAATETDLKDIRPPLSLGDDWSELPFFPADPDRLS